MEDTRPADKKCAGFTLVETMVALALAAFLMASVIPALDHLLAHWWKGQGAPEWQDQWMLATLRLTQDLEESLPLAVGAGDPPSLAFTASANALSFVRRGQQIGRRDGLQNVHLFIEQNARGDRLLRRATAFDPAFFANEGGASDGAGSGGLVLLDGPYRLRFTIIERERRDDDRRDDRKADAGQGRQELPKQVILRATPVNNGVKPVPPLIFPIIARQPMKQPANDGSNGNDSNNGNNNGPAGTAGAAGTIPQQR